VPTFRIDSERFASHHFPNQHCRLAATDMPAVLSVPGTIFGAGSIKRTEKWRKRFLRKENQWGGKL